MTDPATPAATSAISYLVTVLANRGPPAWLIEFVGALTEAALA